MAASVRWVLAHPRETSDAFAMRGGLRGAVREPAGLQVAGLLARAVDRLGDQRAPLRVGALRTLELIARDNPRERQAVVDVICAYLRMPAVDDGPVRKVAAAILTDHLRPGRPDFWPAVGLDLTGATLTELDLAGCRIDRDLRLDHAVLLGQVRLRGIAVGGCLSLHGAVLHEHAWLERASIAGPARLDAVTFLGDAWFGGTTFLGRATFAAADFGGHAWFGGCTFGATVTFDHAVFRRSAGFRGVVAHASVGLDSTTFLGPARVSRRGESWGLLAPGWRVQVDPDNESVGQLLWAGEADLVQPAEPPTRLIGSTTTFPVPRS